MVLICYGYRLGRKAYLGDWVEGAGWAEQKRREGLDILALVPEELLEEVRGDNSCYFRGCR
jgi:hypothetical protein